MSRTLPSESPSNRAVKRALHAPSLCLAVFLALATSGCAVSHKTKVQPSEVRVAKTASESDLIAAYNRTASSIHSINATIEMVPTAGSAYSGVIEQYHQVNGFILAQRPDEIRVIGQAPIISKNIFDMTSDGKEFHIYIPSKNQFIVGPANLEREAKKPIENLRPQHLVDALFWPEIREGAPKLFEEFNEDNNRYYIITLLREGPPLSIDRKLWFDRTDLNLARIEVFDDSGRVLSDIRLSDWQPIAPPAPSSSIAAASNAETASANLIYPRSILIRRPHDDYQLQIKITKLAVNEPISADRFELKQPPGSELVQLQNEGSQDR
jgi:outer membrane lipoprotein-sorting protein